MNFNGLTPIQMNRLVLKLRPIFVGQLFIVESLQQAAFHYQQGVFTVVLQPDEGITASFISNFCKRKQLGIFVYEDDYKFINEKVKEELTKLTRSLSIGDVKKNAIKHTNYLSMQMNNLYNDPFNDELLTNQFQNTKI